MSGWNTRLPNPGATSTTKMADPTAMGRATSVERMVTENDPTIMGKAPTVGMPFASSWCGFHVVPVRKSKRLMPSTANVEMPALRDHGDERHDEERHERDACARDALADKLDAALWHVLRHRCASPFAARGW